MTNVNQHTEPLDLYQEIIFKTDFKKKFDGWVDAAIKLHNEGLSKSKTEDVEIKISYTYFATVKSSLILSDDMLITYKISDIKAAFLHHMNCGEMAKVSSSKMEPNRINIKVSMEL